MLLRSRFPRVAGYRVELPAERLTAEFNADSVLELTPDLVGPSITRNSGIIGEEVDLSLEHLGDMRRSTLIFHVTKRLALYQVARSRRRTETPPLRTAQAHHQGMAGHLSRLQGRHVPGAAHVQELADMACERITAAITRTILGEVADQGDSRPLQPDRLHQPRQVQHLQDRPLGDGRTPLPHQLGDSRQRLGGRVLPRGRVASAGGAYVKNHNLGFEVPYRYGSENRKYRPDFIVLVDDGHGDDDPLHLIVEIKGYRREDAKEKKSTMETYWVPGVNNAGKYGRWAFAEFTEVYQIEADFKAKVEGEFNKMIESVDCAAASDKESEHGEETQSQKRQRRSKPSSTTKAKRKNIPTAEYQSVMQTRSRSPIRVAYERRNRDLDPQLVWRGKDEQDWSDLVVHAPPLYIQEKVHPKVLIDDLLRQTRGEQQKPRKPQIDLFADFNGIPRARTRPSSTSTTELVEPHDPRRLAQVMASLAEREGLRGKVQCIYFDPPYGIKFNSNFQWSTTSRDVKDGNADHITREPEQVKAFRDTWRDGIHSYLTYLRDRLTVARDLLTDSGSIFVQIGDENVHRVRAVMDEVFGEENFSCPDAFEDHNWSRSTERPS